MGKFNFDKVIDRKNTLAVKEDVIEIEHGGKDIIPLWIADTDFEVIPEVVEAIKKRLDHNIFGYTLTPDTYFQAIIDWMKYRFNWDVKKEWIKFTPGVVQGLKVSVAAFTNPGDEVIIQTPVYPPFSKVVKNSGCHVIENPLIEKDGYYTMDLVDLEKKITPRTRLMILCNPHNPVGRVWKKEELKALGDICLKHGIIVVSDEIHSDIIFEPNEHQVFAMISEGFADYSITCTAPNKTFNIAGFKAANLIIKNPGIRKKINAELEKQNISGGTIMAEIALETVYSNGKEWYEELMQYLKENRDFAIDYFKKEIPEIKVESPEGTYLLWLDCKGLNMGKEELQNFFLNECGVLLNEGHTFGKEGEKYFRLNFGTSRKTLEKALKRIKKGVAKLKK